MKNDLWFIGVILLVAATFVWADYHRQAGLMADCLATGRSGVECEMMLRLHGRMP